MKPFKTAVAPATWRSGTAFALGAVICFHLAYLSADFTPLRLLILPYVILLVQLARLRTARGSFYSGLVTGFLCVAPQLACFWSIFGTAAIPLWLILALWIALFVVLTHCVLKRFGMRWAFALIPCLWTGLEYFRSELYFLKFSWLNVGYTFAGAPFQPLYWTGVFGLGFLAALCAGAFLTLRWQSAWTITAIIVAAAGLLSFSPSPAASQRSIRVAGVQLEFPLEQQIVRALDRLLKKFPESDVLVLSEYTLDGPVPQHLLDWCRNHQRYLIVGGKEAAPNGDFYNTAFVISPDGEIVFRQVKSVPIQFFKDGLPATEQALWDSPWGKVGICICYDLSYTRVVDRLVKMGAQLLIVPTMDVADWGKRQHELHGLIAPARAAEHGIPIFRLASSGISQAVDGRGRLLATADFPGPYEMLSAELQPAITGSTPLDRILAPVCVGITVIVLLALRWSMLPTRRTLAPPPQRVSESAPAQL